MSMASGAKQRIREIEARKIKNIMENCVELEVPSKVDTNLGESWGE